MAPGENEFDTPGLEGVLWVKAEPSPSRYGPVLGSQTTLPPLYFTGFMVPRKPNADVYTLMLSGLGLFIRGKLRPSQVQGHIVLSGEQGILPISLRSQARRSKSLFMFLTFPRCLTPN